MPSAADFVNQQFHAAFAVPAAAEWGDSFRAFFDAAGQFFENLAAIRWVPLVIALVCHGLFLTLRTRAWFNALRAAYPDRRFQWRGIWAAELAGNGVSSVIPARAGAVLRLYLGKHTVPESTYPTVGSSFMVQLPFDMLVGTLILTYGFTQGIFPSIPDLPSLNAFDLSFLARHPRFAVFLMTAVPILLLVIFGYLSVRVREFWAHVRQGLTLLRSRRDWLRGAARVQAVGWAFRFASIWYLLEAFNIGGSLDHVLTVLAVQGVASLIPFTPQGAGVQQALLVNAFAGVAAGATVAAYSVGQQLAVAAFNALFGLAALAVVFRTTDWRGLMARGRAEQGAARQGNSVVDRPNGPRDGSRH
ncbi:MAG: flippase-like domain-containing protein [Actinobacteria bacterium]|nr:flippase-like domain-containing protein [Actinomycetota bacterium]